MDSNETSMNCKLEQMTERARELELVLRDYEPIVAEKDEMQKKASMGVRLLDKMNNKQIYVFNELVKRHNSLYTRYLALRERANDLYEENSCLSYENNRLENKLREQATGIGRLKTICLIVRKEVQLLQNRLADAVKAKTSMCDLQRQTEIEFDDKERQLISAQNDIDEKTAQHVELENKIHAEQMKSECIRSSKIEIEIDHQKTVESLQAETTSLQNQLNKTSIELALQQRDFDAKQRENESLFDQSKLYEKCINDLRETIEKEKHWADGEIGSLKMEAESSGAELAHVNKKLCDTQEENNRLKNEFEDRVRKTKQLTATQEHLRREVESHKQRVEVMTHKLKTKRRHRVQEIESLERTLTMKNQELCELRQLIGYQTRQIEMLNMQMAVKIPTS